MSRASDSVKPKIRVVTIRSIESSTRLEGSRSGSLLERAEVWPLAIVVLDFNCQAVGSIVQTLIVRPERRAVVQLCAGEVQCVRCA